VVGIEVERVEVEPLGLDLGTLGHFPAHRDEQAAHLLGQRGQRMPRAERRAAGGERDIDGLGEQDPLVAFGLKLLLA